MYFGNSPLQSTYLTDYLSGDNSTVAFTLARAPISAQSVLVHISGVKQHASTYGVAGTTLTFSEAPPTGTNNIEVLHLGISPETVTLPSYRTITEFTATAGQTTFSPASYTVGYIDVYRNGVKLGTDDFTASNGTTVVLTVGCTDGDLVRFEGFLITAFNDAIPNTAGAVGDSLIAGVSASKVSGVLTDANMPTGSVLQVVQGTTSSSSSTSLTTYQQSLLTASITPTSATSKIFVLFTTTIVQSTPTNAAYATVYRNNATNLGGGINAALAASDNQHPGGYQWVPCVGSVLDSPATTSSTTYTVYFKPLPAGTAVINWATSSSMITLMEIAA